MSLFRRRADIYQESEQGDFVVRKKAVPLHRLILLFVVSFSILFSAVLYRDALGQWGVAAAILAVIVPLCWYTVYFDQRNRDMVLAAEFQNALFAAAARLKSKFCLIVKQDGTIHYFDRGFEEIFPKLAERGTLLVDKIFEHHFLTETESDKLYQALDNNNAATLFLDIPDMEGKMQRLIMNMDPLPRPKGFFIIRGRDYVVKRFDRSETSAPVKITANSRINLSLFQLMHTMGDGAYATDDKGNLLFINYRLEVWLGYNQNEIMNSKLTLKEMLPDENTDIADKLLTENCRGEVRFSCKSGRALHMHIEQELVHDESGNIIGSVAFVRPETPVQSLGELEPERIAS